MLGIPTSASSRARLGFIHLPHLFAFYQEPVRRQPARRADSRQREIDHGLLGLRCAGCLEPQASDGTALGRKRFYACRQPGGITGGLASRQKGQQASQVGAVSRRQLLPRPSSGEQQTARAEAEPGWEWDREAPRIVVTVEEADARDLEGREGGNRREVR